ncbi:15281_t:CDS:10 [Rhizophagus irregularis]|nr:15281_t:CDS:10 [Rhizophagus irregularis]
MSDLKVSSPVIEILEKRVYIGGLSKDINEKDLEIRFNSFGVVSKVDIIRQSTGECRGFAYVTLKTTDSSWKKCMNQNSFITKCIQLKSEWEIQKSSTPPCKKRKRGHFHNEFAEDMSLVTDNNFEHRKGWKKTKYGRAVSVMRLKKDDGTRIIIDPSRYKGNILKFSDKVIDVKPKSLAQLPYFYEEYEIKEKQPLINQNDENKSQDDFDAKSDDKLEQNNFTSFIPKFTNQTLRAQEKRAEREKITQALRIGTVLNNTKRIVFSDNDDTKQDTMKLFDSDESDKDESVKENELMDIVVNPLFEGTSGRDRLNLQKKFHGDERFKLTEDFVSDEEDNQKDEINKISSGKADDDENHEITKLLKEERDNQFDILKVMFGDDMKPEQSNSKKKETQWKNMVHFDPDAPEAKSLEVQKKEVDEITPSLSQPLPKVSKDVKVEINADLKGIFTSQSSNDMKLHDENESALVDKKELPVTDKIERVDKVANQKIQTFSEPLFFFHFGDNELLKRSHFREMKIFMRTSPVEEIVSNWEKTSRDLTKEYKRKHKSVSRKMNKIKKKR